MDRNNLPSTFCNTISLDKNKHVNLLQVGWDKCEPNYSYSHYRDMYIVHVVKSGIVTIETEGHRYKLAENDAFLVRPFELTVQTADSANPCELYYFSFNGEFAKEFLDKTVFKNGIIFSALKDKSLYKLIVDIAVELNETMVHDFKTYEYLFKMLSYFELSVNSFSNHKDNADSFYQKYIYAVQEHIQLNYSKSIRISQLAEQLGLSRSHLYRIFKANTGHSIEEYLVTVRVNAARSLLDDTDFSCSTISSLVGYAHYTTFFKIFKDHTGMTPNEYRDHMKIIENSK